MSQGHTFQRFRHFFWTPGKYTSNLSKVGTRNDDKNPKYDVIIIGGGTAGLVLASRLTEDPTINVLVLEAGGSGRTSVLSRTPVGFPLLFHSARVYELYTEPQKFANSKTKYWPRGKLLGGCSSINAQMAQYGSPADFDEWANGIGDQSWSWKEFSPYFRKFERYIADPQYPMVDTSLRGSQGPVQVGYFNHVSRASKEYITACLKIGIPFSPDFTTSLGTKGVNRLVSVPLTPFSTRSNTPTVTYVDSKAERVSTETAYLTEKVLARPNLRVAIHAQVTRILFEDVGGETRAVGVEFAKAERGPRYRAYARKEVIVAGGAVHSPQILMLSDIGPAEHLKEHGIAVVHDLPGVGSHLVDHPVVDVNFKDPLEVSPNFVKVSALSHVPRVLDAAGRYLLTGKGALAINWGESAAFCRSDDPVLFPLENYPEKLADSTSGPESPDLELFCTPLGYKNHGVESFPYHTFALHVCLLRPISRGVLRLKSANPWHFPSMDPNYCQSEADVNKLVRGVKLILRIARTEPLAALLDQADTSPELDHQLHRKTDEQLAQIVRERVETLYHPACTCRIAPLDKGGVVDSQKRVYGVSGLRVCDASTFPSLVSGHTAGATIAAAEKLSDIIKAEFGASKSHK